MKKNFVWRITLIAAAILLSVIFCLPSTSLNDALPEWLQKYGIVLGLDLQGGVHLVYEVDGDTAWQVHCSPEDYVDLSGGVFYQGGGRFNWDHARCR